MCIEIRPRLEYRPVNPGMRSSAYQAASTFRATMGPRGQGIGPVTHLWLQLISLPINSGIKAPILTVYILVPFSGILS